MTYILKPVGQSYIIRCIKARDAVSFQWLVTLLNMKYLFSS